MFQTFVSRPLTVPQGIPCRLCSTKVHDKECYHEYTSLDCQSSVDSFRPLRIRRSRLCRWRAWVLRRSLRSSVGCRIEPSRRSRRLILRTWSTPLDSTHADEAHLVSMSREVHRVRGSIKGHLLFETPHRGDAPWAPSSHRQTENHWQTERMPGGHQNPSMLESGSHPDRAVSIVPPMTSAAPVMLHKLGISPKTSRPHSAANTIWRYETDIARPARMRCKPFVRSTWAI